MLGRVRASLLFSALLGLAVALVLMRLGEPVQTLARLQAFDWRLVPLVLALTTASYLTSWAKFHYYLKVLALPRVDVRMSLAIFFSGMAMVLTPGKVGELVKALLLKLLRDIPASRTAPTVVADRLSDGLAKVFLASGALATAQVGAIGLLALLVGPLAVVVVVQQEWLVRRILGQSARLPRWGEQVSAQLLEVYESTRDLTRARPLTVAVGLGLVTWGLQGLAFVLVLLGLGVEPSPALLPQATSLLAVSTLVGTLSFLPGGLGAAEGSLALLLVEVVALPQHVAVAATLLIRLCTLWYGVALGLGALAATTHRAVLARRGA